MSVTESSRVHNVCRISRDHFTTLLSPWPAAKERLPSAYWDLIRAWGIDPLFALAMFNVESRFGTLGHARETHSWGNTRPPSFGVAHAGVVEQDGGGKLSRYANWYDGCASTAARLASPERPYRDKGIGEIIDIWAPEEDRNDPESYVRSVLAFMNRYRDQEVTVPQLTDRVDLNWSGPNRPGILLDGGAPTSVTIHCTDNRRVGADAEMHRQFVINGGGPAQASFHAVVDDKESVQLLNWGERGFHIGDGLNGPGCRTSVGIEVCVNADGDFPVAAVKAAKLTSLLLRRFNLPKSAVRTHGSWWSPQHPQVHKNCPANFVNPNVTPYLPWAQFLRMVSDSGIVEAQKMDEAQALLAFGETLPANVRGNLTREGVVDLREFGGREEERLCLYERLVTHRLGGSNHVLLLDLWDRLRAESKVVLYG